MFGAGPNADFSRTGHQSNVSALQEGATRALDRIAHAELLLRSLLLGVPFFLRLGWDIACACILSGAEVECLRETKITRTATRSARDRAPRRARGARESALGRTRIRGALLHIGHRPAIFASS